MSKPVIVTIEITDWDGERRALDLDLSTPGAIVAAMVEHGLSAPQMARILIAARECDAAPADVLPVNKMLLQMGGAHAYMQGLAKQRETGEASPYIGGGFGDPGYVSSENAVATERAMAYLLGPAIGHVRSRLAIIAANGGDVLGVAEQVKAKVDEVALAVMATIEIA